MAQITTTNQMVAEFEKVLGPARQTDDRIEIISQSKTQVGQVAVTFTVGRIKPRAA